LRAADHFADNRGDFAGAQIEAPIELLDRIEDFGVAQMRIMQRRDLHAVVIDKLGMSIVEPAVPASGFLFGSAPLFFPIGSA
jgi:hypothetical protein